MEWEQTLVINVRCIQETRIQDFSSVTQLTSPSSHSADLHLPGTLEVVPSGFAGVGEALSERAMAVLLDWIPVESPPCAVKFRSSCKVNSRHSEGHNLPVISPYAPTDYSPGAVKDTFYQKLHELLQQGRVTSWSWLEACVLE